MQLDTIQTEKEKLGYVSDPSTSVYVESSNGITGNLLGTWAVLSDKYYVASFQDDGILFMGLNMLRKFNGTSHFVPLKEIGEVSFTNTKFMNGRLLLNGMKLEIANASGGKAAYIAYTMMVGEKFWKQNIENIQNLVSTWPSVADRNKPVIPQVAPAAPVQQGIGDQLRELQGLLKDGIISQEEFDAKKKQLLGL